MPSLPKPRYSPEQYLALERAADHKSEFLSGEIFAMAGASMHHTRIIANLIREFGNFLRGTASFPVSSGLRVLVDATGLYTYPDVVIVCGEPQLTDAHLDTLTNATLLLEVLSDSTEAYDRGEKFAHYRRIESLSDYVLVAQDKMRVEHYTRQGDMWLLSEVNGPDGALALSSVECTIGLADVYEGVSFEGVASDGVMC